MKKVDQDGARDSRHIQASLPATEGFRTGG
jgi:hypothetical protein